MGYITLKKTINFFGALDLKYISEPIKFRPPLSVLSKHTQKKYVNGN